MSQNKVQIAMVLGMHRSGTSVLTYGVKVLGAEVGENLIPALPGDNEKGFWEDKDINTLNKHLITKLNKPWHGGLGDIKPEDVINEQFCEEKELALKLLKEKMEGRKLFLFKDPRISILLPFWQDVFQDLGLNESYVVSVRNPVSVAQSLYARNHIPKEYAYLLWENHYLSIIKSTMNKQVIYVEYDRMLMDPDAELARIAKKINNEKFKSESEGAKEFRNKFLTKSLRHHSNLPEDLREQAGVYGFVKDTYEILHDLSLGVVRADDKNLAKEIDRLSGRFFEYDGLFSHLDHLETERLDSYTRLQNLEKEIESAREVDASRKDYINKLLQDRDGLQETKGYIKSERDRALDELKQLYVKHAELVSKITSMEKESKDTATQLADMESKKLALQAELKIYENDYKHLNLLHKNVSAKYKQLEKSFAATQKTLSEALESQRALSADKGQIFTQYIKEQGACDYLKQESGELSRIQYQYREQLQDLDRRIKDANIENAELRRQLNDLYRSNTWRLGAPARFAKDKLFNIPVKVLYRTLSRASYYFWHKLPLQPHVRVAIKSRLFTAAPQLFKATTMFNSWLAYKEACLCQSVSIEAENNPEALSAIEYVSKAGSSIKCALSSKLIAFYLPQFHVIPENEEWWGRGFTEWMNVKSASPQYEGHNQPRVPDELGYYSLLDPEIQSRQVDLAKLYGIDGFCFYFYWFGGRRLLEAPVENYLNRPELDVPFCLCWANENWCRTWDGQDNEILVAQQHSDDDDIAFIQHVSKYFKDQRYIRINNRPLLLIYRPSLFPDIKSTAIRWRSWCEENGLGEIYLAYTQSFEAVDPEAYGFDAAIEFPPNNTAPPEVDKNDVVGGEGFEGVIYDWSCYPDRSERYVDPGYTLFRGVCPSWDNTARRKNASTIFAGSNPVDYQRWLKNAIKDTEERISNEEERFVFINAWNEWAEGAYLEPDQQYGYAYLEATREAVKESIAESDQHGGVILVTHDAYPHGAQMLLLNLAKTLCTSLRIKVNLICLGDGPLKEEYSKWATVYDLAGIDGRGEFAGKLVKKLYGRGLKHAIVNTTVAGHFLQTLQENGITCISLIHELDGVLKDMGLESQADAIARYASKVIFPAPIVKDSFIKFSGVNKEKCVIRPQGLYKRISRHKNKMHERIRLREFLGLPKDAQVVLGMGYADHRKGIDLFVEAGLINMRSISGVYWVWVGHWEEDAYQGVMDRLKETPEFRSRFVFPGIQSETDMFYYGADAFALTSREDPFPSVVLEALDAGVPVVGFDGTGGSIDLLRQGCGLVARNEDVDDFSNKVSRLLNDPDLSLDIAIKGGDMISDSFSFRGYVYDLLEIIGMPVPRLSVVVPNYNYSRYLPQRLESILNQSYPIFEIIFLDDCSCDDSVEVAVKILMEHDVDYRIIKNSKNSSSVFMQWNKGVHLATGEYIWIAEADDYCSSEFVENVMSGFEMDGVVLSYCESNQVDEYGNIMSRNYHDYVADIDGEKWKKSYIKEGKDEIAQVLSVKNTIPNVSGVIFKRNLLETVLDKNIETIKSFKIAGDWMVYVLMLRHGKIAFSPMANNMHRRHQSSVTLSAFDQRQLDEIVAMQKMVKQEYSVSDEVVVIADRYSRSLSKAITRN